MISNIIRVEKNSNYVVMNRTALQDKNLSWKAKGIMAHMLSMPDDWVFYMSEILKYSTDGEASFRSGFKELTERGYVKRYPVREGSRIISWKTVVYESPLLSGFQQVENLEVDSQQVESLDVDNRKLLSTDLELSTESELSNDNTNPVRDLFDHYLSKGIINHSKITGPMKSAISARLKDYTYEQLVQAIDNYATVYKNDKYFFHTKYGLTDLMRDKDIRRFIDDAEPLKNLLERFPKRGGNDGIDRRGTPTDDAVKSKVETTNERRKRIAGIEPNRNPDNPV